MAEAKAQAQEATRKLPEELVEKTREILLAGLGLFATVEEEGSALFNKFVEKGREFTKRGEELEKKGRQFTSEKREELSKKLDEYYRTVESKIKTTLENVGFISRNELRDLEAKVDKLAERLSVIESKLDKVSKSGSKAGSKA